MRVTPLSSLTKRIRVMRMRDETVAPDPPKIRGPMDMRAIQPRPQRRVATPLDGLRTWNTNLSELNVHLARGLRPPPHTPHLTAAQEPLGAPGSLATARLAPGSPGEPAGLARWPRPHGWVTAGSGLRSDPEPRAPPIGGVSSRGRCDGFVIYCC